jgi:integrase
MDTMRKRISSGSVFRRSYRHKKTGQIRHTKTWYLRYYVHGKPITASAETADFDEAVTMLRQKMANFSRQAQYSDHPERVRMDQLFDLVLENYRMQERRSMYDVERKIESRLRPYFGRMKAQDITSHIIGCYVASRLRANPRPKNSTVNRELAYVRRALKLGAIQDPPLVLRVPRFEMLPEDNVREGTLTHDKYRLVRDGLPQYARIALVIGYHTGARKGEIRQIRLDRIDLRAKRIDLPGRITKNKKPRFLPIYGDMAAELDMALAAADPKCPFLIQHESRPVQDWEKAWSTARKAAGVPEALFHDLRRTALTNMIEAGFSEKEAMEISGHKTRAVFDRYHIVSETRLKQLAAKLEQHMQTKEANDTPKTNNRTLTN